MHLKHFVCEQAYQKSSGFQRNLIGKTVSHIAETTDYFTVTTVPDVIQKKEPVMKLSYLPGQKNPSIVLACRFSTVMGNYSIL